MKEKGSDCFNLSVFLIEKNTQQLNKTKQNSVNAGLFPVVEKLCFFAVGAIFSFLTASDSGLGVVTNGKRRQGRWLFRL